MPSPVITVSRAKPRRAGHGVVAFPRKAGTTKNERSKVGGVIDSTAAFTHAGYVLNCAPTRSTEGVYTPSVVILRSSDGEFVANRLFPADLCFTDARAAVEHARQWAMSWIDASRPAAD